MRNLNMKIALKDQIREAIFEKAKPYVRTHPNPWFCESCDPIPASVQKIIKPLFDKLSNPAFLSDCSNVLTSNTNQSYHYVLWSLAPKKQYRPISLPLSSPAIFPGTICLRISKIILVFIFYFIFNYFTFTSNSAFLRPSAHFM